MLVHQRVIIFNMWCIFFPFDLSHFLGLWVYQEVPEAVIHRARAEMGPSADINTVADHAIKAEDFRMENFTTQNG